MDKKPQMTVAWRNPQEPIVVPHFICNVCENDYAQNPESGANEIVVGTGIRAYETYFYTCSVECYQKALKEDLINKFKNRFK
jgi:hypothetical protein